MDPLADDDHDWTFVLHGDGEAFGRIFDRHRDRVYRHSLRLVPVAADAQDVVAVTFLEAWRRRHAVRVVDGSLLPWLLVTATNVSRNLTRTSRRHRALLERLPLERSTFEPECDAEESETQTALRRLSLADQRVLTLCVLEGLSEREAAEALGVPTGTVKSRLSRAKARLRGLVHDHPIKHEYIAKRVTHEL